LLEASGFGDQCAEEWNPFVEFGDEVFGLPPDKVFEVYRDHLLWRGGFDLKDDGDGFDGAVERDLKVVKCACVAKALSSLLHGFGSDVIAGFQSGGSFEGLLGVGGFAVKDDFLGCVLGERRRYSESKEGAKNSE
jgi:hypothetical protein